MTLSAEDLQNLKDRFSELEMDIDAFSTALSRLSSSRRLSSSTGDTPARRVSQKIASNSHEFASRGAASNGSFFVPAAMIMALAAAAATLALRRARLNKMHYSGGSGETSLAAPPTATETWRHWQQGPVPGVDTCATTSCDVAFLAHPGVILSTFARWMPEKRPLRRWEASWWMVPAWPIILVLNVWFTFVGPLIFGPCILADQFEFKGVRNQVWLSRAFGYQFMIKALRPTIARGIEATVREADRAGVSVLGLGALNKAEFINRGGEDILKNVGRAVALKLALDGVDVVCCTTSDERFASLRQELSVLQTVQRQREPAVNWNRQGRLLRARRVDEGVHYRLWVVGKFDTSVRLHVPLKASAIVFAVPCPLEGHRPDLSTVTGGIIRMDVASCTLRQFHVLLPHDQLYACHAAAIVHHRMGWTHHEVGKVDVGRMANILQLARECGFSVPFSRPPPPRPAAATAMPRVADDGVRGPRVVEDVAGGDTPGGFEGARQSGRLGVETIGRLGGDGGCEVCLPRPGGVSVAASGSTHGRGGVQAGGLPPHPPLAGWADAACHRHVTGAGRGVAVASQGRGPQQGQGEEEGQGQGQTKSSQCWTTGSRGIPSTMLQAGGKHGNNLAGNGETRASGNGVPVEWKGGVSGQSFEGLQPQRQLLPTYCRVVVVGAGPSGLSVAARLRARGEEGVVVLERSDSVCGTWSRQYEGLRITTRRAHCGLPGWPVPCDGFCDTADNPDTPTPQGGGDEMSAESFVLYLRAYRSRFDVQVFTDTEVLGADGETRFDAAWPYRGAGGDADWAGGAGGIRVRCRRRGDSSNTSVIRCDHLVVATGKCSTPRRPAAVLQNLKGFSGEVIHSSETSNLASRAAGRGSICIIGMGNSACDLAVALLENGADKVHISTRSAPPIIMRQWGPLSLEWVSRVTQFLPARVADQLLSLFAAAKWGKGWRARVFPRGVRQTWSACASNRIPCIDKGSLVKALLGGRIVVHGPVDWADGTTLRFRETGEFLLQSAVVIIREPAHTDV
eukprot:g6976.t1